jgi:hypothetical protein
MHFQYLLADHRGQHKNKKLSLLLASFCLLTILGLGIICYDDDLLDSNDPPVIALQHPIIIYPTHDEIAFIQLSSESINLRLINNNSFLTRAPPA